MSTAPALTAFALESSGPAARALSTGLTLTLQGFAAWDRGHPAPASVILQAPTDLPAQTVRVPRGPAAITLTF
jgi:hypothetical protein